MTVRRRIDELIAGPAVADLGYPADQRMIATLVLGLRLLADSIDELESRAMPAAPTPQVTDTFDRPPEIHEITTEIHDITEQVGKLAKIIKKAAKQK